MILVDFFPHLPDQFLNTNLLIIWTSKTKPELEKNLKKKDFFSETR